MKSKILIIALTLFLVVWGVGANFARSGACSGESEFRHAEAIDAWVKMWNSYDLNQVDQLFVNCDEKLTYKSSEKPGLIKGISAVRKHHEEFGFVPGGKASQNKLWVEDVKCKCVAGNNVITGTWFFQKDNEEEIQEGPFTAVYCKCDESEYRIAHMHFANAAE